MMAYSWGYRDYNDWSVNFGQQDIPEEIERVINNTVKELFQKVPASNDKDRTRQVHQAIRVISDIYKNKLGSGTRPNWEAPAFRCAYVYLYCLKHSSLVWDILHTLIHPLLVEEWEFYMKVCCVGGGPGSEIIGLMMYLLNMNVMPFIECTVMDLSTSWEDTWKTIQKHLPPVPKVKVNYTPFDMADCSSWLCHEVNAAVCDADLVTFVKSFSAVQTFIVTHPRGTSAIPAVLRALKPGAMLLYVDNMRDDSNVTFLDMARYEGLDLINEWHDIAYSKPSKKFIKSMKQLEDMFDYRPLRGCKVSAFLFSKPTPSPFLLMPMLHRTPFNSHWAPFDGEFCDFLPDPIYRPPFYENPTRPPFYDNHMFRPPFHDIPPNSTSGGVKMKNAPRKHHKKSKKKGQSSNKKTKSGPKGKKPTLEGQSSNKKIKNGPKGKKPTKEDMYKEFDFTADNV